VRRYAYERLGQEERQQAHTVLIGIFEAYPAPERVQRIEELTPQIELYHHLLHAGRYDEAWQIFYDRLATPLHFQFGAYDLRIDLLRGLFPDGEDKPPRLRDERAQAWTLNALANSYAMSGQPRRAIPLFEQHNVLRERRDDTKNLAIGLGNLAIFQTETGQFRAAEANLRRSIALCQELDETYVEAAGHADLGRLLAYAGRWQEAEDALATALRLFEQQNNVQSQGIVWAHRALLALLQSRASPVLRVLASPVLRVLASRVLASRVLASPLLASRPRPRTAGARPGRRRCTHQVSPRARLCAGALAARRRAPGRRRPIRRRAAPRRGAHPLPRHQQCGA
jgi:tetratricopeptide (TPR) repeat protein